MDWKKLALCLALAGGTVACGGTDPGPAGFEDRTHRYVVSVLTIPQPAGSVAYGFDLDDTDTTGDTGTSCVELTPDYTSATDPSEMGVDNGLAGLVSFLDGLVEGGVDGAIAEQIAAGSFLLVAEVGGINSYANDDDVEVSLYVGELVGCDETMPDTCIPEVDGSGLAPGQDFTVTSLGATVPGTIENGRLHAATESLDISVDAGDIGVITLTLHNAQIGANITQTSMTNGAIGGSIVIEELATTAEALGDGYGDIVRGAVQGDLNPDPADETMCREMSAGISFSAVDAVDEFDDAE